MTTKKDSYSMSHLAKKQKQDALTYIKMAKKGRSELKEQ